MKNFDTMVEALNDLKSRGYTNDFDLKGDCIQCNNIGSFKPDQFKITEVYRFEGMTNPGDNSVLYAIESNRGDKGVLVDAYGAYAEMLTEEMIEKFKMADRS